MSEPFDFSTALSSLRDFQQRTVDHVFNRLYCDEDPTRRFLVADEVGLGKTLVARGVIARAAEHLDRKGVKRIDVVYICSNADIARQNIRRLSLPGFENSAYTSRLTLLPLELRNLTSSRLNFIAFTPGTAFTLHGGLGQWKERVVLYWLLKQKWPILVGTKRGPLRIFQGGIATVDRFERLVRQMSPDLRRADRALAEAFWTAIDSHDAACQEAGEPGIKARFEQLIHDWARERDRDWSERRKRNKFVGQLRSMLARTCVEALRPDLVILDEFQRFREVLDPRTEMGELAGTLFDYSDDHTETRTLLLSATPYKMYTLREGSEDEDHYSDFVATNRFLMGDDIAGFADDLRSYGDQLKRLDPSDLSGLVSAKSKIEARLRQVMCRTERLASKVDRNGMLREVPMASPSLLASDLVSFVHLEQAGRELDASSSLEYWKSAAYFPNYWDGYQIGRNFERARVDDPQKAKEVQRILDRGGPLIEWDEYQSFRAIDPGNDRLRQLHTDMIESGVWQMLWMPPSMPYYRMSGVFKKQAVAQATKRLVFSSWNVVPRVVSTLTSYDVSRRMMTMYKRDRLENSPEGRERIPEPLRFPATTTSGMSALLFTYPSLALADLVDPGSIASSQRSGGKKPTLASILKEAEAGLSEPVRSLANELISGDDDSLDDRWYWAAPLILDAKYPSHDIWITRPNLSDVFTGKEGRAGGAGLAQHIKRAQALHEQLQIGDLRLGRMPEDLIGVLALIAVGGPATITYRSLMKTLDLTNPEAGRQSVRDAAARVGWGFRSLFNLPEVSQFIRGTLRSGPYWQKALRYCAEGCLQSVIDEYAFVLREFEGMVGSQSPDDIADLAETIVDVVTLRSADLQAHDPLSDDNAAHRMRCHFALPFGNYRTEDEGGAKRSGTVRTAFNSPFWPFVLTTTSVGQEGLDFHLYCHAIVHWNLPANPVDLEQREGRIHRYMGHAVRKNIAQRHGNGSDSPDVNPWQSAISTARESRPEAEDDLVPFWLYPGEAAIERHVPRVPLSRDDSRLTDLRKSLALYRLAFGQPRQEELVDLLRERIWDADDDEIERILNALRVDLSPPAPRGEG